MNGGEEEALLEHLREEANQEALGEHIRAGGSFASYATAWRIARDEAAAEKAPIPELIEQILVLPVPRWDERCTVRDYLLALLTAVWAGQADGKYGMTGSSDWRYDLYDPMLRAGLIRGWKDGYGVGYREDGTLHHEDQVRANNLIAAAIRALHGEERARG
jgi:hypothetical protein